MHRRDNPINFVRSVAACLAIMTFSGCQTPEKIPGMPSGVTFNVTPLYPSGYDIVAYTDRDFSVEILKDAWMKKAVSLARDRKFKASILTVHETEVIPYRVPFPIQGRTVSGSISFR